jgi:nitrogen fixation/metabolism regulation signal transduction histidine kinase
MKYEMDYQDDTLFEKLIQVGLPLRGTFFGPAVLPAVMIAGVVVSAIGTGLSALSSASQARAMASSSRTSAAYAQQMAARNQQLAQVAADQARAKGEYEAGLLRERQRTMLGKQKALYGASGVDIYGSPLEVMGQTSAEFERDALNAIRNANYEAWRYEMGGETSLIEGSSTASRYSQEADIYGTKATSTLMTAPIVAGTSILTGYGNYLASQKYGYYPRGIGFGAGG